MKTIVYRDPITSLSDLRENIECHVRNILQFMLLSIVEYAILSFQMVADNGGHHIEHVLKTFVDYLCNFNKPMLRRLWLIFETHFRSIKFRSFHIAISQFSCNSGV